MNQSDDRAQYSVSVSGSVDVDATLRLVATLPAPEGLEDRIHAKLRSAPRTGRVLQWPMGMRSTGAWMRSAAMRSAAAAAIVFVVAGGGWGIYTRVQPSRVIVMPTRGASPGGFSGANAMRTPQPFNPPKVSQPAQPQIKARVVPMPQRKSQPAPKANATPAAKAATPSTAPPAK
jgi:hypothetical protein